MGDPDMRILNDFTLFIVTTFIILIFTLLGHTTFYKKLNSLNAAQNNHWTITTFETNPNITLNIDQTRSGKRTLSIDYQEQMLFNDNCVGLMDFCRSLQANNNAFLSAEFYVSTNQSDHLYDFSQARLKNINFLDENDQIQHTEYAKYAPNDPKAIQAEKKSFINFFVFRFILYAGFIIFIYIQTHQNISQSRYKWWLFNSMTIMLVLHYLHFIIQYWINH